MKWKLSPGDSFNEPLHLQSWCGDEGSLDESNQRKWRKRFQSVSVSFAEPAALCHSYSYGLRAIIQCLPAWFRFIQCLRRYRDTKRAFPHLVNAGKYSTTFFVVTFAALYATHRGKKTVQFPWSGLYFSEKHAVFQNGLKRRVIPSESLHLEAATVCWNGISPAWQWYWIVCSAIKRNLGFKCDEASLLPAPNPWAL